MICLYSYAVTAHPSFLQILFSGVMVKLSKLLITFASIYVVFGLLAKEILPSPHPALTDLAAWGYLVPQLAFLYGPILIPSLILPAEAMRSYSVFLSKLGGVEVTSELDVKDVSTWFPKEYIAGAHLPEQFRGVFWMDGNGGCAGFGCSDIASLGAGDWDPAARTLAFPLYAPFSFSHHPYCAGDILRAVAWRWTYVFHFDETLMHADITLRVLGVSLPTGSMGAFEMHASGPERDPGQVWDRPTWKGKKEGPASHTYYLRRIVDQHGNVDEKVVSMFEKAYEPVVGEGLGLDAVQGKGAAEGVCTHPNQVIRTA
jgi:hypothetical protein